ncbi:NUDIX hydrolase [Bacillus sp. Marseille-P3661]|uniref:NUDIX hydrolase n=1 Tax=Bacillus sp. Marseille-P3661 TaxID=1936234 RepID=UPI000C83A4CC|nr:NUDIX hydrolase [Bacillus sp. Marseille-P3661]
MKKERGQVWLAAAGLVVKNNKWLVVKKRYGGLKGKWSLPAGFVDKSETVDEAAIREVLEETGIRCRVTGLLAMRSGVIDEEISDNLLIFAMEPIEGELKAEQKELYEVAFLSPEALLNDPDTSVLLIYLIKNGAVQKLKQASSINPGDHFGYTTYKLFTF